MVAYKVWLGLIWISIHALGFCVTELATVEWNQLLLVSRHQGEVQVWVAWKRSLCAFVDPQMWENTSKWSNRFELQPAGTPWGMDGYGVVVMDLDNKRSWSINDYSHPGAVHLQDKQSLSGKDETGYRNALRSLLKRPDQWEKVRFEAMASSGVIKKPRRLSLSLKDLVRPEASDKEALNDLFTERGTIHHPVWKDLLVFSGEYVPDQWVTSDTRGRSDLDVLEEMLPVLRATGFPAPDHRLMGSDIESKARVEFDEDEADAVVARFRDLLEGWGAPSNGSVPKP